ncbi:hypothetical protein BDB00DRAFT_449980 [Zychaea mexicana]|uniref:uncharacterized protein n=1 Tax=Zychaea mexicana TaxID=64656 RepID=UPI0022FE5147|nr:uncharacterized protein BDB00DRAFT_449980 [Zychaea mexicana]KAI9498467.1 hypothetical protein BDB00DRAFT_449980 [Zychaea mexicana]
MHSFVSTAACLSLRRSEEICASQFKSSLCNLRITRCSGKRALSSSRNIFDPEPNEQKAISSRNKQQQLPIDKPWDGEESVADSVLRMIMDKYNKPLRVEGAARRQLPQPQTYSPHVQGLYDTADSSKSNGNGTINNSSQEESTLSSGEKAILRDKAVRSRRQKRIMNAREAALDYSLEKKYPSSSPTTTTMTTKKNYEKDDAMKNNNDEETQRPRSIAQIGLLAEERIREARAQGHFDNLAGRGKPISTDINENNPFVDRTEYFLNRIVQRQGAAPPWIMMQQEVDTETTMFRTDLERSMRLYLIDQEQRKSASLREWRQNNQEYFAKLLKRLNGRLRSYNVMCPASVRKLRLDLEDELQETYRRLSN